MSAILFCTYIGLIAVLDGPQGDLGHAHGHRRELDSVAVLSAPILVEHLIQFVAHQRSHDTPSHDR